MTKKTERKDDWWRKYTKLYIDEDVSQKKPVNRLKGLTKSKSQELPSTEVSGPFRDIQKISKGINQMFTDMLNRDFSKSPEIQVKEGRKDLIVKVELPGFRTDDITLKVEGSHLIIDASVKSEKTREESRYLGFSSDYIGFRNVVPLPVLVDKNLSKATYKSGILTVILRKLPPDEGEIDIE
jgi:HSP20 family protein